MTLWFHSQSSKNRTTQNAYKDNDLRSRSLEKRSRRENVDEGYSSGHSSKLPNVSKQEAINTLFNSFKNLLKDLSELREGFEKKVHRVRPYVDEKDLAPLWEAKVDESDGRRLNTGSSQTKAEVYVSDIGYRT